ncbi:MAG: hypothetical protein ACRYFB_08635 [Janthinobacterium lividum]
MKTLLTKIRSNHTKIVIVEAVFAGVAAVVIIVKITGVIANGFVKRFQFPSEIFKLPRFSLAAE